MKFTIATNVSNADLPRIKNIIPHWLKVFDEDLGELLIIYDNNNLSGRISKIHTQKYTSNEILEQLAQLPRMDRRVRVKFLDYTQLKSVSKIWFKHGHPIRCQNGSPIFAFLFAIDNAQFDYILKCDCDIIFYEKGFVKKAIEELKNYDLVSPPRNQLPGHTISSRGFFISRPNLYRNLPIILPPLSIKQIASRLFRFQNIFNTKKFSLYFALENALNKSILSGIHRHYQISKDYGNSLHVISNDEANDPFIRKVVESFHSGNWPYAQEEFSMDYSKNIWIEYFQNI